MTWAFLGGTNSGYLILDLLISRIGIPEFVSLSSGQSNEDVSKITLLCNKYKIKIIGDDLGIVTELILSKNIKKIFICRYKIIQNEILKKFNSNVKFINFHFSLLPEWRGVHPLQWAIEMGDAKTGCSVHYINEGIDSGPLLCQLEVRIAELDHSDVVLKKIHRSITRNFEKILDSILVGKSYEQITTGIERYARRRDLFDSELRYGLTKTQAIRKILASQFPAPNAYIKHQNLGLIVFDRVILRNKSSNSNSINIGSHKVAIKSNQELKLIQEVVNEYFL